VWWLAWTCSQLCLREATRQLWRRRSRSRTCRRRRKRRGRRQMWAMEQQ
jgi:hypothetical protein